MSITLFCLVKGDTTANAFSVKINRDESISNLKDAIKVKNQNDFASVDAKRLKLWKVEIASDRLDDRLKNLTLNDSNELLAMDEIGEYWADDPPKKHINVLVESPMSIAASSREQADKDKKSVYGMFLRFVFTAIFSNNANTYLTLCLFLLLLFIEQCIYVMVGQPPFSK